MGIRQHPQVRSESESAGPAQGPGDLQREVHFRMEDPEGGVPRHPVHPAAGPRHVASRGARCAAASAAARWMVPRVHLGKVEHRVHAAPTGGPVRSDSGKNVDYWDRMVPGNKKI